MAKRGLVSFVAKGRRVMFKTRSKPDQRDRYGNPAGTRYRTKPDMSVKGYYCKECGAKFKTLAQLKHHINTVEWAKFQRGLAAQRK